MIALLFTASLYPIDRMSFGYPSQQADKTSTRLSVSVVDLGRQKDRRKDHPMELRMDPIGRLLQKGVRFEKGQGCPWLLLG